MALPLKDFPLAINPHSHKVLQRIASNRGIHLNELGREIIDAYVRKVIHDAKIILGQDDDNPSETESDRLRTESHRIERNAPEKRRGGE